MTKPLTQTPSSPAVAIPSSSIEVDTTVQTLPSLLKRFWQYQPSSRLVNLIFAWWLLLFLATAFKMTYGFGYEALDTITPLLFTLCIFSLAILALLCLFDWLWLMAVSQASHYSLNRDYPSNVPIYHEQNIHAYLSFKANLESTDINASIENHYFFPRFLFKIFNNAGLIKSIELDFSDSYPDHLMLTDTLNRITSITSENELKNAVMSIPVMLKVTHQKSKTPTNVVSDDRAKFAKSHNIIKITYPVLPIQRGTGYFSAAYLRIWSPFKLLHRQITVSDITQNQAYLRVLADFSGLLNNQLAAIFERSPHSGLQTLMQQGHGSDFLNLREYAPGDAIRQIDWKASSRQQRLMSKSYEDDNDQQVMFLLDCGEQMRHQDDGLESELLPQNEEATLDFIDEDALQVSYFDKVLNAVLLLSYIANKQSDSVGLMTFGGVNKYIAPKKGVTLVRDMLNDTADIKPTMQTSDYLMAAQSLKKQLKKRSLVIMITNTRVEASDELIQAVRLLAGQHQIVFANLTEQIVNERLHGEVIPADLDEALLYHALNSYEKGRLQLHKQLGQESGALCFHTTADKLPSTLIQAYMSLKR